MFYHKRCKATLLTDTMGPIHEALSAQSTRIFWADGICTKYFADSQIQHWILIGVFIGDCGEKYTTSDQV